MIIRWYGIICVTRVCFRYIRTLSRSLGGIADGLYIILAHILLWTFIVLVENNNILFDVHLTSARLNKFISRIRKLLTNVDRRKTRIRPFKPKDDTDVNTTRLHACKYTIYITPHYRVTLMYNYNTHYTVCALVTYSEEKHLKISRYE